MGKTKHFFLSAENLHTKKYLNEPIKPLLPVLRKVCYQKVTVVELSCDITRCDPWPATCDPWPVIHDPRPVTCGLDPPPNLCSYIICVRSSAETIRVLKSAILPFIRSWRYWLLALWPTGSVLVSAMGKTETCSTVMFLYYFPISIFWLSCVLILSYNYPVETFFQVW